jgi:NADH-quinone oxidoreductase subunit F
MEKLSSIGKLEWLRNKILSRKKEGTIEVHVCMTGCRAYGAAAVLESLKEEVKSQKLSNQVEIRATGCHGFCAKAPVIAIEPMGVQYQEVEPDDAAEIVAQTVKRSQLIDRLAYRQSKSLQPIFYRNQIPFYAKQERRVLANCGRIDPTRIEHYIAAGGYQALVKALSKLSPEQVINEVQAAKLRGRGGAQVYRLQRGRRRPRRIYGSRHSGRRPPCRGGRDAARRLCHGQRVRIYLCPRRVSDRHRASNHRH